MSRCPSCGFAIAAHYGDEHAPIVPMPSEAQIARWEREDEIADDFRDFASEALDDTSDDNFPESWS